MGGLVLDSAQVRAAAQTFRGLGTGEWRSCPSISLCGSDEVIGAFVQAFLTLRDQEANTLTGWTNLATRADESVAAFEQADAALAGASS